MFLKLLTCFLFLFVFATRSHATIDTIKCKNFPDQRGWVNDFEQVLDSNTTKALIDLAMLHQENTSDQICIVTIAQSWEPLSDYAKDIANAWGIGVKGKNNGIVIVFSKAKREVHISTGIGLEQKLTDAMCKKVIDESMIPKFRNGDYNLGLIDGVKELIALLEKKD
jgi:uncharacterized protein